MDFAAFGERAVAVRLVRCADFPYNAKLCLNGHEYAKRQLVPKGKGVGFETMDQRGSAL